MAPCKSPTNLGVANHLLSLCCSRIDVILVDLLQWSPISLQDSCGWKEGEKLPSRTGRLKDISEFDSLLTQLLFLYFTVVLLMMYVHNTDVYWLYFHDSCVTTFKEKQIDNLFRLCIGSLNGQPFPKLLGLLLADAVVGSKQSSFPGLVTSHKCSQYTVKTSQAN